MKLRNKKTGEIVYATMMASYGGGELQIRYYPIDRAEDTHFKEYHSIAELNEEWEDYEEPKDGWFIQSNGLVKILQHGYGDNDYFVDMAKQIGNYFETKEEAEKAVEKLKAWKRLEDKGFRFVASTSYVSTDGYVAGGESVGYIGFRMDDMTDIIHGEEPDIPLLFGGEE